MKSLKIVASIIVALVNIYIYAAYYGSYERFFESTSSFFVYNIAALLQVLIRIIKELLEVVLVAVFLFASSTNLKDKAYRLLRYLVIMSVLIHIPVTVYLLTVYPTWQNYLIITAHYFATVLFLIAKPDKVIGRINLADYEMVAFTSGGNRFLHYLLDMLFLMPYWMIALQVLSGGYLGYAGTILWPLLFIVSYLMYYFLSEAIFRQTLGKIATGSCVVSNGPKLSTGRILLRTIARLIPFDTFSFLFKGNWHDRVTSTNVVYIDTWEKIFEDPQ